MENIPEIINNIRQVFIDYYNEENVDLQKSSTGDYNLIIRWNTVTVTNEVNTSIDIWGLYSKLIITHSGKLVDNPQFIRAVYDKKQWESGYRHSHIQRAYNANHFFEWTYSCLGSGPINHTLAKLKCVTYHSYNRTGQAQNSNYTNQTLYTDMDVWGLLAYELDKYVGVESISGGPYYRIAHIAPLGSSSESFTDFNYTTLLDINTEYKELFKKFFKHYVKSNKLSFGYKEGKYIIGSSFVNTVLDISNAFINWVNTTRCLTTSQVNWMTNNKVLVKCTIDGDTISIKKDRRYSYESPMRPIQEYVDRVVLKFKGNEVKMTSREGVNAIDASPTILSLNIIGYFVYTILRYVNSKYAKTGVTNDVII